ncbi:hypothetical protein PR001_g6270 [Phytophthora rubi]|uniref:Aminotransferase class I/classII domain-containing protein n=1 Tax=Phytophthora rubi TaxID=129364 RepID=A0A6A3NL16_9STRA|nr:hypothetical protein PR002_g17241 [Phytophthora rubi]KAE9042297.1 hypothetical protein PR001_g6270 [Phytophthora rubi]
MNMNGEESPQRAGHPRRPRAWCNGASGLAGLVTPSVQPGGYPKVALTCPVNPTGDYMDMQQMKTIETNYPDKHTLVIDESIRPWVDPHSRQDALIHQCKWIKQLSENRRVNVWTEQLSKRYPT